MVEIGEKLYAIRLEKGLTQQELVMRSGVPQPNLSNIEKGRQDITVSTLLRLCDALRVPPASIFSEARRDFDKMPMTRERVERFAKAVWGDAVRLNENEQRTVQLLQNVIPISRKRKSQKTIYSGWNELRKKHSDAEIRILIERVRDEEMRRHAKKRR